VKNSLGLSVIVITRNEEEALPACLESVKNIADQIVLVDSGSTDKTLDIAKSYNSQIFHRDWAGYSAQKQFALEKAAGPWVLNIDADERLTPEVANEIREMLSTSSNGSNPNGYDVPFQHFFCGKRLRFGGVQGESHLRLFKKDVSRYGQETVHEGIQVTPPLGRLQHSILHYSYKNIHDYLTKCNDYTTMIARKKYGEGSRFHWWHHLRLPWEFVVRYFLKLGFLDGTEGFIYALLSSYYVWLKYAKLRDCEGLGK
jgi:glycosyltransferase involved in cell wall biosynthesis